MRSLVASLLLARVACQGDPKNGNIALVNDPSACAADLTGAVAAITSASNKIVHGVAACPPKTAAGSGKDKSCASAIIGTVASFSSASQKLASASKSCANTMATAKGSACGKDISSAIKTLGVSSGCLIASTESCKPPTEGGTPFGCVVDVVDVVDSLANAAHSLANSVKSCELAKTPDPNHAYLYDTWLATGCSTLPSPDWIQWGYWFATSTDQTVMTKMFDWCMAGKMKGNLHATRLCCNSGSTCNVECNVQNQFSGNRLPIRLEPRTNDDERTYATELQ